MKYNQTTKITTTIKYATYAINMHDTNKNTYKTYNKQTKKLQIQIIET